MRLPLDEEVNDIGWQLDMARSRVYAIIDARCEQAFRVIRALAERDRRGIGQLTRFDHIINRINRRNP